MLNLHYDPMSQRWSLYHNGSFYTWEGDPFNRAAAEAIARQITFAPGS